MKLSHPRAALLGVGVLALLTVAGCGGGNDDNTTPAASTPAPTVPANGGSKAGPATSSLDVSETEYKLNPADPTVKKGTVQFNVTNAGKVAHSLEVEGPGGESQLRNTLQPGSSATLNVDLSKPGKYEWYCPIGGHKDLGMKGEITVK